MTAKSKLILLASAIALAGCGQSQQVQNENQCQSYGYKRDTTEFSNCLLQLHTADQRGDSNLMTAIIMSQALSSMTQPRYDYGSPYRGSQTTVINNTTHYYPQTPVAPNPPPTVAPSPTPASPIVPKPATPVVKNYTAPASTFSKITSSFKSSTRSLSKK